ncbi:hypothetical protein CJ030_MR3G009499 [Morella rubra]|uniref:Uncharacterized protein n=1 Tax=Morella rubra TaxID=262757 RepID=A0A6A1W6Z1_9ROSI|nr:hypothetical protein CJ030_MR3G009499 [Morella rubra]
MFGVGWECFPGETYRTNSSLHWKFGFVPKSFKREILHLDCEEQSWVDALNRLISVDWDILLCQENVEEFLGYSHLKFYGKVSTPSKAKIGSRGLPSADNSRRHSSRPSLDGGSRRGSPSFSLGGSSSKHRHSRGAEDSSCHSGSKRRKVSPPVLSDIEEEEAEDEVPLALKSSRHGTNSGYEDTPCAFSPISGVHTEVTDLEVRDILEVEVPSSRQPSVLKASIAYGSRLPLVPSTSGKEPIVPPVDESALESSEEFDSPIQHLPLVEPARHSIKSLCSTFYWLRN